MMTTSFDDLPQDSTAEILLRLPVKDLIRSSSVNKTWYSLINNPSFISCQIGRAISSCHENSVLIIPPDKSHQNYCSLISAHTSELIEKFDIPFETNTSSLKLVGQIHGLLLLCDWPLRYASTHLYLWNPYVKRHRLLVSTCFQKLFDRRQKVHCVYGMGFDKATDDYKVIRILYVVDDKRNLFGELAPKVEIYSLRKNTWREMENLRVPCLVKNRGINVDGCCYWLENGGIEEARTCYRNRFWIISFDFQNELFGEFKVPNDVPHDSGSFYPHKLMQFEDSLAVCIVETPLRIKWKTGYPCCIWLMRQENGLVTWTLRFKAFLKERGLPLDITKNGTLIIESFCLRNKDLTSIVSCNLKSMIHKDHGGPQFLLDVPNLSSVNTSFPETLIMYEGGKSLLKYAK